MKGKSGRSAASRVMTRGALGLGAAIAFGTAHADLGIVLFTHSPEPVPLGDRLEILGNGHSYSGTQDAFGLVDNHVSLSLDAGFLGRVKRWDVWIQSRAELGVAGGWLDLPERIAEAYPLGSRPKTVDRVLHLPVSFSEMGAHYCNAQASELRAQGLADAEIFAVDRTVQVELRPALTYEMSSLDDPVLDTSGLGHDGHFDLVCKAPEAAEPDPAPDPAPDPQRVPLATVTHAGLILSYDEDPSECPTEILAHGLFTSDAPGRFTVRLRDAFGRTSQPLELEVGEADRQGSHYVKALVQGFVAGVIEEGDDGAGGGDRLPDGLGLQAEMPDEESPYGFQVDAPLDDRPLSLSDDQGAWNEHVGAVRFDILEGGVGSVAETGPEEYRFTCPTVLNPDVGGFGPGEVSYDTSDDAPTGGVVTAVTKAR